MLKKILPSQGDTGEVVSGVSQHLIDNVNSHYSILCSDQPTEEHDAKANEVLDRVDNFMQARAYEVDEEDYENDAELDDDSPFVNRTYIGFLRTQSLSFSISNSTVRDPVFMEKLADIAHSQFLHSGQKELEIRNLHSKYAPGKELLVFSSTATTNNFNHVITLCPSKDLCLTKYLLAAYCNKEHLSFSKKYVLDVDSYLIDNKESFLKALNRLQSVWKSHAIKRVLTEATEEFNLHSVINVFMTIDSIYYLSAKVQNMIPNGDMTDECSIRSFRNLESFHDIREVDLACDLLYSKRQALSKYVLCASANEIARCFATRYVPVSQRSEKILTGAFAFCVSSCGLYYIYFRLPPYKTLPYHDRHSVSLQNFYRDTNTIPALGVYLRLKRDPSFVTLLYTLSDQEAIREAAYVVERSLFSFTTLTQDEFTGIVSHIDLLDFNAHEAFYEQYGPEVRETHACKYVEQFLYTLRTTVPAELNRFKVKHRLKSHFLIDSGVEFLFNSTPSTIIKHWQNVLFFMRLRVSGSVNIVIAAVLTMCLGFERHLHLRGKEHSLKGLY